MVGITKNGIHTRVPANSTRVRHSSFTARLDRSANANVVMISCISSGLATIRTYPSLAKLLDAPVSTVASTHRPPICTVAVIRPLLILNGRLLDIGLLLRSSPLRPHLGKDVVRFPGYLGDNNRQSIYSYDHSPNKSSGAH